MIIYMSGVITKKIDEKNCKKEEERVILMKTWEGSVYDGKSKFNHNLKVNMKNTTDVKYIPQLKPFIV